MPTDCFVSVRVGEMQKFSKFAPSRTYKFKDAGDRSFGKIELFRRIGGCTVNINPAVSGLREVNLGDVDFGVAVLDQNGLPQPDSPSKKSEKDSEKAAAMEYLSRHHLEERLSEAMKEVLRERPDNPSKFMSDLLAGAAQQPVPAAKPGAEERDLVATQAVQDVPKPAVAQPDVAAKVPAPCPAKRGPQATQAPVDFPAKRFTDTLSAKPAPAWRLAPSVGTWLQPKPAPAPKAPPAPPPKWNLQPSVGTWLARLPPKREPSSPSLSKPKMRRSFTAMSIWEQPALVEELSSEPSPPAWHLRPSVGTWLAYSREDGA